MKPWITTRILQASVREDARKCRKETIMVAVLSNTDVALMPTSSCRARILLRSKRAEIVGYHPFTIRLLDRETGNTQPIEYKSDTGSVYVGVSICSEKHEYISEERILLDDEKKKHDNCRTLRRTRRNRLRYRKPRFDNREKAKGWIAPTLQNKLDRQLDIFHAYKKVMPITSATFEVGKFDIQLLAAMESGKPVPEGKDYQQGARYQQETLRQAVFFRDSFTCQVCQKGVKDGVILRMHHIGFRKNDHSDRMANLLTVCTTCHSSKNHNPGGELWDLKPEIKPLHDAAFMNTIRWKLIDTLKETHPDVELHFTYGARTKCTRRTMHIGKSHANDAYCIGEFHPKHRCDTVYYQKQRRNNRVLEKFYDAVYLDLRTGEDEKAAALGSGRTKRNTHLAYKDQRPYRGRKVSSGHRSITRKRSPYKKGDILRVQKEYTVKEPDQNGKLQKVTKVMDVTAKLASSHSKVDSKTLKAFRTGKIKKIPKSAVMMAYDFTEPLPNGRQSCDGKHVKAVKTTKIQAWKRISKPELRNPFPSLTFRCFISFDMFTVP